MEILTCVTTATKRCSEGCEEPGSNMRSHFLCECVSYLNVEKSRPNMVCKGIRNMSTTMPAKHDGPISAHSSPTTAAAWRGPTHRKCRKIVTYSREFSMNNVQRNQKYKNCVTQLVYFSLHMRGKHIRVNSDRCLRGNSSEKLCPHLSGTFRKTLIQSSKA